MTRKEALEVSKRAFDRYQKTRDIQWKLNVAIWTLIIVGIYTFEKEKIEVSHVVLSILVVLLFLAHLMFVFRIVRSLNADLKVINYVYDQLNKTNDDSEVLIVDVKQLMQVVQINSQGYYWIAFQIVATGVLLAIFLLVNS